MSKNIFLLVCAQALSILLLILLSSTTQIRAHGGEDHSEGVTARQTTQGSFSISGFGEVYELTVAYDEFEKGENVALRLFVANLETNKPVSDATLTLTLTGPELDLELAPTLVETSPGEYAVEVSVPRDADYSFLVEITTSEEFDLFSVDGFSPPPPSAYEEEIEPTFSVMNYSMYFIFGGYVLVAMIAYTVGTRERSPRRRKTDKIPIEES